MKNIFRKNNVIVFSILFLTVVTSALIFYTFRQYRMPAAVQPNNFQTLKLTANEIIFDSTKPEDIIRKIYQIVDPSSDIKFKTPGYHRIIWRTEDSWDIFDRYAAGIEMPIPVDFCEREVCVRNANIKTLNQKISRIFLRNGFTVNQLNTSASEDDDRFYDYILAFENGDTKCTLATNLDMASDESLPPMSMAMHYSVACSDQIKQRYDEELPFLNAINNHRFSVIVEKIVGNFARIESGGRTGSGMFGIVKKINGSWKIIVQAQEAISCGLIDKYQIPREIYPIDAQGCYEQSGMPPVFDHLQP